jgi:hypothetical protein
LKKEQKWEEKQPKLKKGKARFPQGIPLGDSPTIQKLTEAAALFVPPLLPLLAAPLIQKVEQILKSVRVSMVMIPSQIGMIFDGHDSLSNWHHLRWS